MSSASDTDTHQIDHRRATGDRMATAEESVALAALLLSVVFNVAPRRFISKFGFHRFGDNTRTCFLHVSTHDQVLMTCLVFFVLDIDLLEQISSRR